MATFVDPFASPSPEQVSLPQAPLVRVIAQVRFPKSLAVEERATAAAFQKLVQVEYPVLRHEQIQTVIVGPEGTAQAAETSWRFADVDNHWRLSLAPEFLALETTNYTSRADFLDRLQRGLSALHQIIDPKLTDRIGVRYIDRVTGPAFKQLPKLVRPEALGIFDTPLQKYVRHALTESLLAVDDGVIRMRTAVMPPNATHDPTALEPVAEPSWILDLDMFSEKSEPFAPAEVMARATRFTERVYALFRSLITEEFLRQYGGKP
jgi:uncharacterized protein (TIGR04255 family)